MIIWTPGMSLEDVEEKVIEKAYNFYNKDSESTSKSLKISLHIFEKKLIKFAEKQKKMNELIKSEKDKEKDFNLRSRGINSN